MAKTDTKKPKRRTSSTEVLRAPPINTAGRLAAQTSGALQQVANSVVPNPAKLLSGDIDTLPIGDWLLGDTTGMLDRWSKGRAPVTFPAYGSKLVNAKFDPAIIDALSVVAPGAKSLMKVGVPLAKAGAKAVARNAVPMIDRMMVEKYGFPSLQPSIVKNTGGEWQTGGTDGPSNLDRVLIDLLGSEHPGPPVDEVAAFNQKYRKMLKNYIVNDMGAATDPIRMSIDRGISHADVPHSIRPSYLNTQAEKYGLPKGNLAATHEGRRWEDRVDQLIGVANLGEWQKYRPEKFNKSYPWLAQKDPSTIIHDLEDPASFGRLGFDHMRDVLLDKYMAGEITPEQLRNLNMEKAVRIVHAANQAAAAGAGEAEAKGYATNLLLPRSKEYPSGHFISELPDPTTSDEAMALVNKIGCEGGWCTQKTGSAMDYGSNRSRLHTLFDSEGRPHVQFEVKKDISESPTNEEKVAVMKEMQRLGLTGTSKESRETYMQLYPEKVYTTIEQMKPPGNTWWSERGQEYLKRNPSYQNDLHVPMQDFVKSGNWNDVKDLHNAGLYKMSQSGMRPALEHRPIAQELGVTPEDIHDFHLSRPEGSSPYFSKQEFHDFMKLQDTPPIEKAGGGIVKAAGKGLRGLAEKYRLAHEIAQKNAALPVSKGGLGLPPDNTALDRAKALGFDIYNKYFHGTGDDFTEFDPNSFFTTKPHAASTYALDRGNTYAIDMHGDPVKAANVMPVYVKAKKYADDDAVIKAAKKTKMYDPEIEDSYYYTSPNYDNFSAKAAPVVTSELKRKGYDAAEHYDFDMDGNEIISSQFFDPSQIRSTNAAFDPFRRGEADILAGVGIGLPVTGVVNRQEPVKKAKGGKVGHPNEYVEKVQSWGRRGQMDLANRLGMGDEVKFAATIPEKYYPASEQHNGPGDAMRHLLLQAQLQQKYGDLGAKAVGWGHELVGTMTGESPAEKEMDDYNDALGRKIGAEASDKADMAWRAMQAIKSGEAHTIQHPKEDAYAHGGEVDYDKHYEFVQHTPISSTIDHDAMYMFRDEVQGFAKGGPVLSVGRGETLELLRTING